MLKIENITNLDLYITACRRNINKNTVSYSLITNLTNQPQNLFRGFPPVYLIGIDPTKCEELYSITNIKLSIPTYYLREEDKHWLQEYYYLSLEYNEFLKIKKEKRQELKEIEALYKYDKYITKNHPSEYYKKYIKTREEFTKFQHFDRVKIVLLDDVFQYFLGRV